MKKNIKRRFKHIRYNLIYTFYLYDKKSDCEISKLNFVIVNSQNNKDLLNMITNE